MSYTKDEVSPELLKELQEEMYQIVGKATRTYDEVSYPTYNSTYPNASQFLYQCTTDTKLQRLSVPILKDIPQDMRR